MDTPKKNVTQSENPVSKLKLEVFLQHQSLFFLYKFPFWTSSSVLVYVIIIFSCLFEESVCVCVFYEICAITVSMGKNLSFPVLCCVFMEFTRFDNDNHALTSCNWVELFWSFIFFCVCVAMQNSPVYNYINSLSPIKPVRSLTFPQTIGSLSYSSPPSVFTSPHASSHKGSRFKR